MARPDTHEFASYMSAAGTGLVLAGTLFGTNLCKFGIACHATIWDFFFAMGAVLLLIGGPIALVGGVHQFLMNGE